MKHERDPASRYLISFSQSPFFLLMSLIDNQTEAVIPQDAGAPGPCLFVIVSWQSEMPARPGWQLAVLTAALPENGTLPVELQLPPLLLPLRSIACRCCINTPCQGDCNNCEIHAMFQRHVNFSSGTIKEGNTVPGFLQALKSEKGFSLLFFPKRGGCFIRVQKSTLFFFPFFLLPFS